MTQKTYTWEEIRSFLAMQLKNTNHILTWGTIGSCNVEHDLDFIITKKPQSRISKFYKEVHVIYDALNQYLTELHGAKILVIAHPDYEEDIKYIADYNDSKDLVINSLLYLSLEHIKARWAGEELTTPNIVERVLNESYNCLKGKKEDLFSDNFRRAKKYENFFTNITNADRTNTNTPSNHSVRVVSKMIQYIVVKNLRKSISGITFSNSIRDNLYLVCDMIDQ